MERYKIEFFTRSMLFTGWALMSAPDLSLDYLSLGDVNITIPTVEGASAGDFAHITDRTETVYQGIVKKIENGERGEMRVTISPLLSLFDVQIFYSRANFRTKTLDVCIAEMMTALYISTTDTVQKINGMTITNSVTGGQIAAALAARLDDDIHNLWDIITEALTSQGIVIAAVLNPQTGAVNVTLSKSGNARKLDINLPSISDVEITLPDEYGKLNKVIFIDESGTYPMTTVTKSDYTAPAVWTYEKLNPSDDDVWATICAARAAELFAEDEESLIEFSAESGNSFLDGMKIGDKVEIYINKTPVGSTLTAWERTGEYIRYTFGLLRLELSKIEIIKGRANK